MTITSQLFTGVLNSPPCSFHYSSASFPSSCSSVSFKHRRGALVFSYSESGITSAEEKILRERYGFDPSQIIYDPVPSAPKTGNRRRSESLNDTKVGKQISGQDDKVKPKRTTHQMLQVIGGRAKRKKLLSPKGMDVRPMMQVVKGSVFDILQAAGGCPSQLRPGRWLDLYSGTGSVGIEAISRGCSEAHFVEMDPWVVSNIILPNLKSTGFLDAAVIHTIKVDDFLQRLEQKTGENMIFDYISVTPPYTEVDYSSLMDQISNSRIIGDDTFIVVEYPLKTDIMYSCGCLSIISERRFGRTKLAIYGPSWAQKRRKDI